MGYLHGELCVTGAICVAGVYLSRQQLTVPMILTTVDKCADNNVLSQQLIELVVLLCI